MAFRGAASATAIWHYASELIDEKRRRPQNDFMKVLAIGLPAALANLLSPLCLAVLNILVAWWFLGDVATHSATGLGYPASPPAVSRMAATVSITRTMNTARACNGLFMACSALAATTVADTAPSRMSRVIFGRRRGSPPSGQLVDTAMGGIERDNPVLKDPLPSAARWEQTWRRAKYELPF